MSRVIDPHTPREDANRCFVCGPGNPKGLKVPFRIEGDRCVADFTPGPDHVGWDNVTHGGILFSLLDDVMANWLYLNDEAGHTARCEVRYRRMLPVGEAVRLEGWEMSRRGRMAQMAGRIVSHRDGGVIAECEARFMLGAAPPP